MNLTKLKDRELLQQVKQLVKNERQLLTQVLHHLREVERRRLFSDLGYQSLFEYAVKELRYSEGQAGRRIQAMRLIKELPHVEKKIAEGKLTLSNLSQAQSYFRSTQKLRTQKMDDQKLSNQKFGSQKAITTEEKLNVLEKLENKSYREAESLIMSLQPQKPLPAEKLRPVSQNHTEVKFIMDENLKNQLDQARSLLGAKGATMSMAELILNLSELSIEALKAKRFGKKRTQSKSKNVRSSDKAQGDGPVSITPASELGGKGARFHGNGQVRKTPAPELMTTASPAESRDIKIASVPRQGGRNARYISKQVKYQVWQRDGGRCLRCGSQSYLQYDHVKPVALGGESVPENLRLLCFNCNQRQAVKIFGAYIRPDSNSTPNAQ